MSGWTPARARRLDELAGPDGVIVGVAVDHRDSLRAALAKKGIPKLEGRELSELKLRIVRRLAPAATLILLDVEHGAAQALAGGALPRSVALGVALEAQGYGDVGVATRTTFLPNWSPAKAARLGASACKLLLPYRSDVPEQAEQQEAVVREAVAACRAAGTALVLEPIVYPPVAEGTFAGLVVEGARRLALLCPDVLKMQHPGSPEACSELDAACGPDVPWVLLGGGADAASLEQHIREACSAGASGFIVGRTLWDQTLDDDATESERLLAEVSLPLLERLRAIARLHATPWRERVGSIPPPAPDWYRVAS